MHTASASAKEPNHDEVEIGCRDCRFGLLVTGTPLLAHHSFLAQFDQRKPMKVTGVVSKIEWMNPHAYFYVDGKDQDGKVANWSFETASPSALEMRGWKRDSLKIGDHVTVQGYHAKGGLKHAAVVRSIAHYPLRGQVRAAA